MTNIIRARVIGEQSGQPAASERTSVVRVKRDGLQRDAGGFPALETRKYSRNI
jgi:hypothetical protein